MINLETIAYLYINKNDSDMYKVKLKANDTEAASHDKYIDRNNLVTEHNAQCYALHVMLDAFKQVGYCSTTTKKMREAIKDYLEKHPNVNDYYSHKTGHIYE